MFKNFVESYIFNKYKDKCFKNSTTLKGELYRKYKIYNVDLNSVYVKIVNYQIKKYDSMLTK